MCSLVSQNLNPERTPSAPRPDRWEQSQQHYQLSRSPSTAVTSQFSKGMPHPLWPAVMWPACGPSSYQRAKDLLCFSFLGATCHPAPSPWNHSPSQVILCGPELWSSLRHQAEYTIHNPATVAARLPGLVESDSKTATF